MVAACAFSAWGGEVNLPACHVRSHVSGKQGGGGGVEELLLEELLKPGKELRPVFVALGLEPEGLLTAQVRRGGGGSCTHHRGEG